MIDQDVMNSKKYAEELDSLNKTNVDILINNYKIFNFRYKPTNNELIKFDTFDDSFIDKMNINKYNYIESRYTYLKDMDCDIQDGSLNKIVKQIIKYIKTCTLSFHNLLFHDNEWSISKNYISKDLINSDSLNSEDFNYSDIFYIYNSFSKDNMHSTYLYDFLNCHDKISSCIRNINCYINFDIVKGDKEEYSNLVWFIIKVAK